MLASLLPGLRELRAPLAAGYLWLLSAFLLIAPHVPGEDDAKGIADSLYSLRDAATAVGIGVAASFVAYLVGTLSTGVLNPLLRAAPTRLRRLRGRAEERPDRISERSWRALRDLVIDSLRQIDSVLADTPMTLPTLVGEEVPDPGRRSKRRGLVARVLDAVASELDLVKTRLLGKEVDLFSAADRHQAEADFRLAVLPPLVVLAGVLIGLEGFSWISLVALAVGLPMVVGLWRQAFAADASAADVLVDALRLERVESPTLERLASAARRTAGLEPDAQMPALRQRKDVIDGIVEKLRTAASWARPQTGGQLAEDARTEMRVASDGLELLEICLPHASHVHETAHRVQDLLQSGTLSEAEVTELEEAPDVIKDLAETALERPGQVEELVGDEGKLRAALESADPQQRLAAALALPELLASTGYSTGTLNLVADAARKPELASSWLRRAFETAARRDPGAVTSVSWQAAGFAGANLAGLNLTGIDFRDADLAGADLSGTDLYDAQLHNASLVGANLHNAMLIQAKLVYTDLAQADLTSAHLASAEIEAPLVKDLKLAEADLDGALFDPDSIPWYLTEGWETALLSEAARESAKAIGGRSPNGPKVLMFSWEAPPLVAGGSWTACWHLVRSLRSHGADVTVVVPWAQHLCEPRPFGTDVEVIFAGIEPFVPSPYIAAGVAGSPYLPYSAFSPYWWGAAGTEVASSYAPSGYDGAAARRAVDEFASWVSSFDRAREFDLIHAHDWVTFPAAEVGPLPWVAHFHSTVADRRPDTIDYLGADFERQIEGRAMSKAAEVVAPSRATEAVLGREYGIENVNVIPNPLAREAPPPRLLGQASSRRIAFIGRLARQKGPDRFLEVARWSQEPPGETGPFDFVVFGDGEERALFEGEPGTWVTLEGAVPWAERDRAFEGATVVLVPSRSEPFGMVIAEAMQRGVPVIYPEDAGIAEVVDAGISVDPASSGAMVAAIENLVSDPSYWQRVADKQVAAIRDYAATEPELLLRDVWQELASTRQPSAAR